MDIFICDAENRYGGGLSQRVVKSRLRAFKSPNTSAVVELDGEGWVKTTDKDLVLRNLKLLGIRKHAERSPESKQKLLENLKSINNKIEESKED